MRALGWTVTIMFGAAVVAGVIAGLTGWDSDRVYAGVLGASVFWLCERSFGDERRWSR